MWWIFMSWSADFGCNQQVNQTTPLRWPCYRLVTKAAVTRVLTQSVSLLFLWLFFQQILMRKFKKKRGRVPDVADVFVVCNEWLRYAQPPCTGNGLGESKFPHVSTFKKKKKKKKFEFRWKIVQLNFFLGSNQMEPPRVASVEKKMREKPVETLVLQEEEEEEEGSLYNL